MERLMYAAGVALVAFTAVANDVTIKNGASDWTAGNSYEGSASGLGLGFVKSLANETFDDVSVHPYRRFVDEREFLADLDELYAASRGRDVWMTEIGWDSFPGFRRNADVGHLVSLHEYASLIARAYMTAASGKGVRAVFGYDFVDDGLLAAGFEYHMGIVYGDASPKPAYRAVAKVCRTFPDGKPCMTVGDDGLTVSRMGGKCAVWVHASSRARSRRKVRQWRRT